jgi:hypothetical protein
MNFPFLRSITPAKWYIGLKYFEHFCSYPNFKNPKTFNEKLQWLKIYNRNPLYTKLVDKCSVRDYIKDLIGEQYLIPLLGVPWKGFDDIPFDTLPNRFVLKCNHDSASVIICRDKNHFNYKESKIKLSKALKYNFYWFGREWPYKNIQPKIIAETLLVNQPYSCEKPLDLKDYKLMCFNGKVKCSFVCGDRFSGNGLTVTFFDRDWNELPFERSHPKSSIQLKKPQNYDLMITLAEKISKDIPFVRVDFYETGNRVFFGEMTFFPGSGFEPFQPQVWDEILGDWISL